MPEKDSHSWSVGQIYGVFDTRKLNQFTGIIMRQKHLYGPLLLTGLLTACGGGGGGGTGSSTGSASSVANIPPVAVAGVDQQVFENTTVTLTGSGTDADGSVTGYQWSQTSGETVTLTGGNQATATFQAPTVSTTTALEFALRVTDNSGATSTDSLTINVEQSLPIAFSSQPDSITKDPFATFQFTAQGSDTFECRLDQGDYASCASPHTVFPLAPGAHELSVRALRSDGTSGGGTALSWTVSSIFGDEADAGIHPDVIRGDMQPDPVAPNSWRGILRINCDFAHSSYDDPVVFPNQDEAAHLHRFYGNTLVDETSEITSLFTSGESSCQGNVLNRSAYWYPALLAPDYNAATGERLTDAHGDPAWKAVSAVVGDDDVAHEIFYYSAGVDDLDSIQSIPLGLKMIAGSHMGQPGMEQDSSIVRWHCQSWESSDATNPRWSAGIPECLAPDRLRMDIFFPSCWNGTDLDSDDHKSHLAYPVTTNGNTECPAAHPVPIIRVSFHYAFGVKPDVYDPATLSSRGWRLASDMYDGTLAEPGGMSLHADWFNAWHPEALQAVLDTCIKQGLDCHDGNLANGFRLSGTRPGTQFEPAVTNKGLGAAAHP